MLYDIIILTKGASDDKSIIETITVNDMETK